MKLNLQEYVNYTDYNGNKIISWDGRWCLKAGPVGFVLTCLDRENSTPLIGATTREWCVNLDINDRESKGKFLNQSFMTDEDRHSTQKLLSIAHYLEPPVMKITTMRSCGAGENYNCTRLKRVVDAVTAQFDDLAYFVNLVHDHKGWLTVWFRGRDVIERSICDAFTKAWLDEGEPEEYVKFETLS